ncbi:peptidoglycan-binding domain-containing protein [Streptomyces sp. SAI-129]|uniref:peptidoglycan-binding domain-containing protein n=1 Tax=Streptomyces sp. SAI-129 TaxID=3377727 RepID=UPI003C7C2244
MTRTHLAATAACAAATLALSAWPASAKISDGYVRGYDTYVGDWGDEGTVSTLSYPQNNAVCLWQTILWAEGANESDGTDFDGTDIDGIFGGNTHGATKRLQVKWGLASSYDKADGMVGPVTFGRADNQLVFTDGSTARGKTAEFVYNGPVHDFAIERDPEGKYRFRAGNVTWTTASYSSNTCD